VEPSRFGPRLSAPVDLVGSAFLLSFSKTQAPLDQLLGMEISCGGIATIRQHLNDALAQPMAEALQTARQQSEAYVVDEVLRVAVETVPPQTMPKGVTPMASAAGSGCSQRLPHLPWGRRPRLTNPQSGLGLARFGSGLDGRRGGRSVHWSNLPFWAATPQPSP